jgi:hypothetical protein
VFRQGTLVVGTSGLQGYTEALVPESGLDPNCFKALGSYQGLLQDPIL